MHVHMSSSSFRILARRGKKSEEGWSGGTGDGDGEARGFKRELGIMA